MKLDMEGQICERCKEGVYKSCCIDAEVQLRCDHCGTKKQKWSDTYDGKYLQITMYEGKGSKHYPPMESFPEEDSK